MIRALSAILTVYLGFFVRISTQNVIGIDFGSENMKVGIVSPGSPLEIVTNFQSKRKTPTCISFYKGERLFGSDAFALMPRKPELTFSKIFRMIGRDSSHPHLEELEYHYFPYEIFENETLGLTSIKHDEGSYTPEELLAMMMQHARDMTKNYAGKNIRDCVLTVPSFFSQHERLAMYTAASIADFNVLSLIEENTAAALNFGMDRVFDEPTSVLFYNMGSSSVQVSIVRFTSQTVKDTATKNKTLSQFEVVGKGWDSHLGGFSFDMELTELLANRFNEAWIQKATKNGQSIDVKEYDIRKHVRAMTRLRLEALKVKEVLSANAEYPIKIEQLHADVDLITKVTRAEFEVACERLFARVTKSIDSALAMAHLNLKNISAVEIIGGGVRVPKVKRILEEYFSAGDLELGQHLNGDEAMAMGAAFRAANLSTAFKVRKIGMQELSSFGVAVEVVDSDVHEMAVDVDGTSNRWTKRASLFPRKTIMPSKIKTVTFTHDRDISCRLEYDSDDETKSLLPPSDNVLIGSYNITGISKFISESASNGVVGLPKIHLSFLLDGSGIVSLSKAEIAIEPVDTESAGVIEDINGNASSTADETSSSKDTSAKVVKKDTKPKRSPLKVVYNFGATTPRQWTPDHVEAAKERLRTLDAVDKERKDREAAMNNLEGYMYSIKNKLSDNSEELNAVSTEADRQRVSDLCDAIEEWLYGEGRSATVSAYMNKEKDVKMLAEPIFLRLSELSERPAAVARARKQISGIRKRVSAWSETMPQITSNETDKLMELVDKTEAWLDEKEAQQAKKTPFEEPNFLSSDIPSQMKSVASMLDRLLKKPKPKPVPSTVEQEVNSTEDASDEDATNSNSGADGFDDPTLGKTKTERKKKQKPRK